MSVSPEAAATLSTMGVTVTNAGVGGTPPVNVPAPGTPPAGGAMLTPTTPLGFVGAGFQAGGAGSGGAGGTNPPFPADGFSKPKQDDKPETKPEPKPEPPATPPAADPKPPGKGLFPIPATPPASAPTSGGGGGGGPVKTAADFPNPEPVRRVYVLAYAIYTAANPPTPPAGPTGEPAPAPMRLLPAELGTGSRPVYMAFTIAATEIIAGAMLLIGMLSRLWALAVACVMIGAIWLTGIGPAMASGDNVLGFLPNYPWGDMSKWMPLLWQVSLLAMALAVFFAGSGALAVDNAMFGSRADRVDADL